VKVFGLLVSWFTLVTLALRYESLLFAFLASVINNMSGFCIMHDASHYGVSKSVFVNRLLHILWCDWNFWAHFSWATHHVYGHHSYTGIYQKDPDLINAVNYVRKHPNQPYKPRYETQHIHSFVLLGFAPNQHLGQSLTYLKSILSQTHLLNIPIINIPLIDFATWLPLTCFAFYMQFIFPFYYLSFGYGFLMILTYWTTMGMGYMLNVIPNHDTLDTHHSAIKDGEVRDWGMQQVCATGNHSTDGSWWSQFVSVMYGGMNWQIEHHLYPQVSHVHYPAVGNIVKETCAEFGLTYVTHSWGRALYRHAELLWLLSFQDVQKEVVVPESAVQGKKVN